jgi:predicted TIM-barrel fold metal-dependent hydrolase
MWKTFKVIDADAHMHEPQYLWERYIEASFRDRAPKVVGMDGAFFIYEGQGSSPKGVAPALPEGLPWEQIAARYGDAYKSWWSPQSRLKEMDNQGWDVQVLLPTGNNGNFAFRMALRDAELGAAMCRAYNNWAAEYCSANPKRLKFVAVLPGSSIEAMVTEARRAVDKLGAVSVRNPLIPEGRWLHESEYDKLWALACELDFPISVHGEYRHARFAPFKAGAMQGTVEDTKKLLQGLDHALGFPFDNMTTLGHFIFGGVLERFPSLRLAILESNAGWLPFWLGRMDDHSHGRNAVMGAVGKLPKLPSEYVKRQCYISCDSDETALAAAASYMNGENLVWNSDYPHPDAIPPGDALPLFDAQQISPDMKRKILWDNSVKLFGERIVA